MKMKIIIFLAILHIGGIEATALVQDKSEIDPKEEFFRHIRFYDSPQKSKPFELDEFHNIPVPGGFQLNDEERLKRSYHVLPSAGLTSYFQKRIPNEKLKYKRIKRQNNISHAFEEANDTKPSEDDNVKTTNHISQDTAIHDLIINDFIRFKRQTSDDSKIETEMQSGRQKREPEVRTKKLMMDRELNEGQPDREREARGATKEQWIKQPYPVERPMEDNVASASASASESVRAPRVHFVTTQRRGGDRERERDRDRDIQSYHHEREARARDSLPLLPPQPHYHTYPYQPPPPPPPYLQPRPRSYESRYYEPYFQRFDDRDRRYGFDAYAFDDGRSMLPLPMPPPPPPPPPPNKQRRIIYYATLPEVVRSPSPHPPQQHGAEQRYSYRSGYEADRYMEPDYYRTGTRTSTSTSNQKQYERPAAAAVSTDQTKTPLYPVKVSTDVNVREPKKNPERRIYSEVDRRFTYKPPSFQTADEGNF